MPAPAPSRSFAPLRRGAARLLGASAALALAGAGSAAVTDATISLEAPPAAPRILGPAARRAATRSGRSRRAPATDIGFDPRCITRAAPAGSGVQSWWIYAIDYDHVRSVGGVAGCFAPRARSGAPDLGAYAR